MKRGGLWALVCAAVLFTGTSRASGLFDPANRINPAAPPPALLELRQAIADRGPVQGSFTESRAFPFKRDEIVLSGQLAYSPGQALELRYEAPEPRNLAILAGSLVEMDDGGSRHRPLPQQFASLTGALALDVAGLGPGFNVYFEGDASSWSFGIEKEAEPIRGGRRSGDRSYTLSALGSGSEISTIVIDRPGAIRVRIELTGVASADESTRARLAALLSQ